MVKDAEQMTPDELRNLADKKELDSEEAKKPYKKGKLKHDLYYLDNDHLHIEQAPLMLSSDQLDNLLIDIKRNFDKHGTMLKKDTMFFLFDDCIYTDRIWIEPVFNIEFGEKQGTEYLTNIEEFDSKISREDYLSSNEFAEGLTDAFREVAQQAIKRNKNRDEKPCDGFYTTMLSTVPGYCSGCGHHKAAHKIKILKRFNKARESYEEKV